jgi:WD40 repeat protein
VQSFDGPPGLALAAIATSSDGRIAVASERATWLVDVRGEAVGHTSEVTGLASTGATLVSAGLDGRLVAWDEQGRATDTASIASEALVMVASGARIVAGAADGTITSFELAGGRFGAPTVLATPGSPVATISASPDGRYVLASRGDGALFAVPAGGGAPVPWQQPGSSGATAVAFSRDATWVATGHLDGTIRVWRVTPATSGAPSATLEGHTILRARESGGRARYTLAFDDMDHLLVSRFGDDSAAFSVPALDARSPREGRLLAASPDRVATFAPRGEILLFHGGELTARVATSARPLTAAAFSPDGSLLVTGDVDGMVRVVDVARAEAGATDAAFELPAAGEGAVTALATSRDHAIVVAGHATGALRSHAITADLALHRACDTLAYFGRAAPACASVP